MTNPVKMKQWSSYLVGAGIGVLSWFAFASANHPWESRPLLFTVLVQRE